MGVESLKTSGLDPASPITPQIFSRLRAAIIRNEFSPGERISESEIAGIYGVSRQPVRETFIRLAGEGLLAVLPQRGTFITKIGYAAVLDARFLREAIEADIAMIHAASPDPALVRELRRQLKVQSAEIDGDPKDFIELDERFHRTLAEAAGTRNAWRLIEGLKAQLDRVRFLSLGHLPIRKLIEQHQEIVDCIEAGDAKATDTAVRFHLREILRDLPVILDANPEFFNLPEGDVPMAITAPIR